MSFKDTFVRNANLSILKIRKASPEILTAGAILSGVACIGFTIRQTLSVRPLFDEVDEFHEMVEKTYAMQDDFTEEQTQQFLGEGHQLYTKELETRDTIILYTQIGWKLTKHYMVPLAFGALSVACILGAYKVSKARYAALAAAYTGLQGAFDDLKEKLKEKLGSDEAKELIADALSEQMDTITDEQTGRATKQLRPTCSQYARFFDESSIYFKREAGDNLSFLQRQEAFANQLLRMNGCVFLNEVYDMLGFPRTKAGSIVGWIWNPTGGDKQIDFGYWNLDDQKKRDFINGWERSVLLDFNVDGVIYDLI